MVLNLLRVEDINPEWLLSKSFYQFQHCNKVPKMITALKDLEKEKVIFYCRRGLKVGMVIWPEFYTGLNSLKGQNRGMTHNVKYLKKIGILSAIFALRED